MSELYIRAASRLGWLLQALEDALHGQPEGAVINLQFVRRLNTPLLASEDEAKAALDALADVGVLSNQQHALVLRREALSEKLAYCRGVRKAVETSQRCESGTVKLCAALPGGLDSQVEKALRRHTIDMRSALIDLIATAREWLILASPFWDTETVTELAETLSRRLEAGVKVDILGRFDEKNNHVMRTLQSRLGGYERCQLFAWHEVDSSDWQKTQTFHFKALVADNGAKAYLGTANFTTSGLRSRMELGVILEGEAAQRLAQIIKVTLNVARPLPRTMDISAAQ
jgi:phosphatidylserine/phosphatidylglycerophosphate/cardiolipin synthase-like enzyme